MRVHNNLVWCPRIGTLPCRFAFSPRVSDHSKNVLPDAYEPLLCNLCACSNT